MAALPQISSGTVSVGCKLPSGIHMDMNDPKPHAITRRVTLRGSNASRVVGGFGITENVDKEFVETWLKRNAELPAVKNELIFIMKNSREVSAKAKELAGVKSGMERIDPKNLPKGIKEVSQQEANEEEDN